MLFRSNCNGGGDDGGGGDCLTGDCLNCAVTPQDPRCCKCKNKSEKQTACQKEFNFAHVTRLNVTVEVGLTSKNCRTGDATCSNNFYIFNPTIADVNPILNQVELWAKQPFPGTTNCGFNSTYWSRGLITVTPKYLGAGEVGDTKFFEGWPNFNID